MIAFALLNWRWLLPTAGAAVLAIMLGVTKIELSNVKAAVAQERLAAAELLATTIKKNAEIDARNSELARNLDQEHAHALETLASTRGDFERQLAERVRRAGAACRRAGPTETPDPGRAAGDAPGGALELQDINFRSLSQAADGAMKLAATVRECVTWAAQVGR